MRPLVSALREPVEGASSATIAGVVMAAQRLSHGRHRGGSISSCPTPAPDAESRAFHIRPGSSAASPTAAEAPGALGVEDRGGGDDGERVPTSRPRRRSGSGHLRQSRVLGRWCRGPAMRRIEGSVSTINTWDDAPSRGLALRPDSTTISSAIDERRGETYGAADRAAALRRRCPARCGDTQLQPRPQPQAAGVAAPSRRLAERGRSRPRQPGKIRKPAPEMKKLRMMIASDVLTTRSRRRPPHALRSAERRQAAVAADDRDRRAVGHALREADREITGVDEATC